MENNLKSVSKVNILFNLPPLSRIPQPRNPVLKPIKNSLKSKSERQINPKNASKHSQNQTPLSHTLSPNSNGISICSLNPNLESGFLKYPRMPKDPTLKRASNLVKKPNLQAHLSRLTSWPKFPDKSPLSIKWNVVSQKGSAKGVPKDNNQDSYLILTNLCDLNLQLFAVFDGHGSDGHQVSSYLSTNLEHQLSSFISKSPPTKDLKSLLKQALASSLESLSRSLQKKHQIDSFLSGSTAVVVIIHKDFCICANIGDSRAVLGNPLHQDWVVFPLSRDHKAEDQDEKTRVETSGGEIRRIKDLSGVEIGPSRVYLKGERFPGLAITRSIGDLIVREIGVIPEAEMLEADIGSSNQVLIIATDGLWEFVSSLEAVKIAAMSWGDPKQGTEDLLLTSITHWVERTESVDDITIILVFLVVDHNFQ